MKRFKANGTFSPAIYRREANGYVREAETPSFNLTNTAIVEFGDGTFQLNHIHSGGHLQAYYPTFEEAYKRAQLVDPLLWFKDVEFPNLELRAKVWHLLRDKEL
jgi:hypothetical protein